jgi:hypothetical protein
MTQEDKRLGERGAFMVDLVGRYRLVTVNMLQSFFPNENPDSLRILLDRLVAAGWLLKLPLGNREHYYCLGSRAQRMLVTPAKRSHKIAHGFGHDGVIQHLAIGLLCARNGLLRLREEEFVDFFTGFSRPGLPAQNYIVRADGSDETIYWALVDHATNAGRFPGKVGKIVASRFALPAFRERILAGSFAVAVLTGAEGKARQIEDALSESPSQYASTGVIVVPELESLLVLDRRRSS